MTVVEEHRIGTINELIAELERSQSGKTDNSPSYFRIDCDTAQIENLVKKLNANVEKASKDERAKETELTNRLHYVKVPLSNQKTETYMRQRFCNEFKKIKSSKKYLWPDGHAKIFPNNSDTFSPNYKISISKEFKKNRNKKYSISTLMCDENNSSTSLSSFENDTAYKSLSRSTYSSEFKRSSRFSLQLNTDTDTSSNTSSTVEQIHDASTNCSTESSRRTRSIRLMHEFKRLMKDNTNTGPVKCDFWNSYKNSKDSRNFKVRLDDTGVYQILGINTLRPLAPSIDHADAEVEDRVVKKISESLKPFIKKCIQEEVENIFKSLSYL